MVKMIMYSHKILIRPAEFKDLKTNIKFVFTGKEDDSPRGGRMAGPHRLG